MGVWKRFTFAAPAALNAWAFATHDRTGFGFINVRGPNRILDILVDPANAAGIEHEIELCSSGGIPTGKRWSSTSIDPASQGRGSAGLVRLKGGQYNFNVMQRLGALTALSFRVLFEREP